MMNIWYDRAALYGDSFFETMLASAGEIALWPLHKARIEKTIQLLGYSTDILEQTEQELPKILKNISNEKLYKIRWQAFRNGRVDYYPNQSSAHFHWKVEEWQVNDKMYLEKVVLYALQPKAYGELSSIKSGSALLYVQAASYAKKMNADEAVILSADGLISEFCRSNIFVYNSTDWITPNIGSACVDGVFRRFILTASKGLHISVKEDKLSLDDIKTAKCVVACNALRGVQVVKSFEDVIFDLEPAIGFLNTFHTLWNDNKRMKELFDLRKVT